jgi:hypothetical protein
MLAGERDPEQLAALSHPGIHATRQTIARSLGVTTLRWTIFKKLKNGLN